MQELIKGLVRDGECKCDREDKRDGVVDYDSDNWSSDQQK